MVVAQPGVSPAKCLTWCQKSEAQQRRRTSNWFQVQRDPPLAEPRGASLAISIGSAVVFVFFVLFQFDVHPHPGSG